MSDLEAEARVAAESVGLLAHKPDHQPCDDESGFMLLDSITRVAVAGFYYDLKPQDVIEFCAK